MQIVIRLYKVVKKSLYATPPGGLSIYWAIMIGVIIMSGYLVGGLVPKRNPTTGQGQTLSYSPPAFQNGLPVLQLGSLNMGGCRGMPAVMFLIDSSDSMLEPVQGSNATKLDKLKTAILTFTAKLTDNALVSIVSYSAPSDNDPYVRFPFKKLGPNREALLTQVGNLGAGGLTYFREGVELADQTLTIEKSVHPEYSYNLIVVSDGIPETLACIDNHASPGCVCKPGAGDVCFAGEQNPLTSPSVIQAIKDKGVNVYTVGIRSTVAADALYETEYNTMLTSMVSQPISQHFIMTPSANELPTIMNRMGSSLCLDTQNAPVLATPSPTPTASPTPPRPTNTPTPTASPTPPRIPNTPTPTKPAPFKPAADIMLVIDTSHSMENGKLDKAKLAANAFIDIVAKNPANRVGIASFDNNHGRVNQGLSNSFAGVKGVVNGLAFDRNLGSCLECVMVDPKSATDVLRALQGSPNRKIVILLSDGEVNRYIKNNNPNKGSIQGGATRQDKQKAQGQASTAINQVKGLGTTFWVIDYGGGNAAYLQGISGAPNYRLSSDANFTTVYQSIANSIVFQ